MIYFAMALIALGGIGCLAATLLFPLLALLIPRKTGVNQSAAAEKAQVGIEVLIPAHNEAATIAPTIAAIREAAAAAACESLKPICIRVGADACADQTARAAHEAGADSVIVMNFQNKWQSLVKLLEASNSDWVALVDSGAIWPKHLILSALPLISNPNIAAIAPSYQPSSARAIERWLWKFEALVKGVENISSGPVSIHGATVIYRTQALRQALQILPKRNWLNDDLVIPSAIHVLLDWRIHYLCEPSGAVAISDLGIGKTAAGLARRKRLVAGNIEWLRLVFPRLRANPAAFILALRRAFRVFWCYWLIFLAGGIILLAWISQNYPLAFAVAALSLGAIWKLRDAALASLLAPFMLMRGTGDNLPWT